MRMVRFRSVLLPTTTVALTALLAAALACPAPVHGERKTSSGDEAAPASVELFAAMESGQLEVKLIPKDAKQATVLIANKTDKPLRIALPEAFAGVPALKQALGGPFGGGPFGGPGGGLNAGLAGGAGLGLGGGGMNQGIGGGFDPLGGGPGIGGPGGGFRRGGPGGPGGGFPGGFFNIAPERTVKRKAAVVCLEHGKDDPHPRIPYTLVPLEAFNDDPQVREVCTMLARGEVDQPSAQAAVWHFTDELSFRELAAKVGVQHHNGSSEPLFTSQQVARAKKIAEEAERRAARHGEAGKGDSLSRK
jgi:hypothetical protein